jgi:hypothetical protein
LVANKEAEDAIVAYLREQQRVRLLEQATREVIRALEIGLRLYEQGVVDYQRVLDSQRAAVQQQDALAQSRGQVAINLVAVYKALGGGWAMRCADGSLAPDAVLPAEILPDSRPAIPPPAEGPSAPSPATILSESHGLSQ